MPPVSESRQMKRSLQVNNTSDFAICPRRKAGQQPNSGDRAQPIFVTKSVLERYFHMSLNQASKELGICATAIKKVCRKLGILKWPYRDRNVVNAKSATDVGRSDSVKQEAEDTPTIMTEEHELKVENMSSSEIPVSEELEQIPLKSIFDGYPLLSNELAFSSSDITKECPPSSFFDGHLDVDEVSSGASTNGSRAASGSSSATGECDFFVGDMDEDIILSDSTTDYSDTEANTNMCAADSFLANDEESQPAANVVSSETPNIYCYKAPAATGRPCVSETQLDTHLSVLNVRGSDTEGGEDVDAMASSPAATAEEWCMGEADIDAGDLADDDEDSRDAATTRASARGGAIAGDSAPLPDAAAVVAASSIAPPTEKGSVVTTAETLAPAACAAASPAAVSAVSPAAGEDWGDEEAYVAGTNIYKYMSYQTACDPAARRRVLQSLAAAMGGSVRAKSPPPPGRYPLTDAELLFLAAPVAAPAPAPEASL